MSNFTAPVLTHGDIVSWWKKGITSNTPLPAMVVLNSDPLNLTLHVFAPDGNQVVQGVKNVDDPERTRAHTERAGCWGIREVPSRRKS